MVEETDWEFEADPDSEVERCEGEAVAYRHHFTPEEDQDILDTSERGKAYEARTGKRFTHKMLLKYSCLRDHPYMNPTKIGKHLNLLRKQQQAREEECERKRHELLQLRQEEEERQLMRDGGGGGDGGGDGGGGGGSSGDNGGGGDGGGGDVHHDGSGDEDFEEDGGGGGGSSDDGGGGGGSSDNGGGGDSGDSGSSDDASDEDASQHDSDDDEDAFQHDSDDAFDEDAIQDDNDDDEDAFQDDSDDASDDAFQHDNSGRVYPGDEAAAALPADELDAARRECMLAALSEECESAARGYARVLRQLKRLQSVQCRNRRRRDSINKKKMELQSAFRKKQLKARKLLVAKQRQIPRCSRKFIFQSGSGDDVFSLDLLALDIDHIEVIGPPEETLVGYFCGAGWLSLTGNMCNCTRFARDTSMVCLANTSAPSPAQRRLAFCCVGASKRPSFFALPLGTWYLYQVVFKFTVLIFLSPTIHSTVHTVTLFL